MNRKYVLTADHCFVDKTQINNFQYWCAPIAGAAVLSVARSASYKCRLLSVCSMRCRLLIFKYNAPCGATVASPITSVIQVWPPSKATLLPALGFMFTKYYPARHMSWQLAQLQKTPCCSFF